MQYAARMLRSSNPLINADNAIKVPLDIRCVTYRYQDRYTRKFDVNIITSIRNATFQGSVVR